MEEKFMLYWGSLLMHSCLTAIVDLRLKLEGVEFCMSEIYENLIFSDTLRPSFRLRFSHASIKF